MYVRADMGVSSIKYRHGATNYGARLRFSSAKWMHGASGGEIAAMNVVVMAGCWGNG